MIEDHKIPMSVKIALAISLILWSSAFVGIRVGLQGGYTPGSLGLLRFLVASVVMGVIYLNNSAMHEKVRGLDSIWLLLISAIGLGTYHLALNYGELTVSSGVASFLINQSPIMTTLLAMVFLGETINGLGWLGLLISIVGVTVIFIGQSNGAHFDVGACLVLLAAFAGSVYTVFQKPFLRKYHAIHVTAYGMWGCALALLAYLPTLTHEIVHATFKATASVVYLGIFPAAIASLSWSYALSKMPASRAMNFIYIIPLITTGMGWLFLSEVPVLLTVMGGCLALLGVWVLNVSYRSHLSA